MTRNVHSGSKYLVQSYEPDQDILETTMSVAEIRNFPASQYDYLLAPALGIYAFRSEGGDWNENPLRGSGMGKVALNIIRALQVSPGIVQTRGDIAILINEEEYYGAWPLPARIRMIRKAHGESGSNQRMFLSDASGGYYWPRDLSWCWVDRLTSSSGSVGISE